MTKKPIRVLTNIPALVTHPSDPLDADLKVDWKPWRLMSVRKRRIDLKYDIWLIALPTLVHLVAGAIGKILTFGRLKLYYYDFNLPPEASGVKRRFNALRDRVLVRFADRIFLLHADVPTYARRLAYPSERFEVLGFKANNYERFPEEQRQVRPEGDYILSCGQSYRDYPTFLNALSALPHPGCVVLPPKQNLKVHGGRFESAQVPSNVRIENHDGSTESWDQLMLKARIVVVALRPETVQPAGISVCLEAMNLGKAVLITEGPLTRGEYITSQEAKIVAAGDSAAMAAALDALWRDDQERERLARGGLEFAKRFGGTAQMVTTLAAAVYRDINPESHGSTVTVSNSGS